MLKQLLQKKTELESRISAIQEEVQEVMNNINNLLGADLKSLRQMQSKEFGTVHLVVDGIETAETVPKKIEWDQDKLNSIFMNILSAGDKPSDYMRVKLEVPEKTYDSMTPEVRSLFTDARTVKPGKVTYKFKEVGNV